MKNLTTIKDSIVYPGTLFCYFLLPPFAFFAPRSSVTIFLFLSIFSVVHFFLNDTFYSNFKRYSANHKTFSLGALLFLVWLGISAAEAYPFKEPISVFLKFSSMLFLGGILFEYIKSFSADKKRHFLKALFAGCVLGAIFVLVDVGIGGKFSEIKQCEPARVYAKITLIISMIAPLGLFYIKNHLLKLTWAAFFLIMFYFGYCDTATLSFITACSLYYLLKIDFIKTVFYKYIPIIVFLCIMILPFGMKKVFHFDDDTYLQKQKIIKEQSYKHRLEIWKDVTRVIDKKPLLGHGVNASKREDVIGANKKFTFEKDGQEITEPYGIHHPHNYILQLWLELGGIGALIWGFLTFYFLSQLKHYPSRKMGLMLFSGTQIHLLFSISIWQTWWWATLYFILPLLSVSRDE